MKNEIINSEMKNAVVKDGVEYVRYNIAYPSLKLEKNKNFEKAFNSFYKTLAENIKRFAETRLFERARKKHRDSVAEKGDFAPFAVVLRYICAYSDKDIVSIVTDASVYCGGDFTETKRLSQNWHREKTRLLVFEDFFLADEKKTIIEGICREAKLRNSTEKTAFYNDYEKKIKKTFVKNNFYLTPKGYGFFYPAGAMSDSRGCEVFFLLGYRGKGKYNPYKNQ